MRSESALGLPKFLDQAQEQVLASIASLPCYPYEIALNQIQITDQFQEFGGFNRRAVRNVQVVPEALGGFQRVAFSNIELDGYRRALKLVDAGMPESTGGTHY